MWVGEKVSLFGSLSILGRLLFGVSSSLTLAACQFCFTRFLSYNSFLKYRLQREMTFPLHDGHHSLGSYSAFFSSFFFVHLIPPIFPSSSLLPSFSGEIAGRTGATVTTRKAEEAGKRSKGSNEAKDKRHRRAGGPEGTRWTEKG